VADEEEKVECSECNDIHFVIKDGKRIICKCQVQRRIKHYLKDLNEIEEPGVWDLSAFDGLDTNQNLYILWNQSNTAKILGLVARLLLTKGTGRQYKVLQTYELVEIYLGLHPLTDSLFKLDWNPLILISGLMEMENKRIELITLQVLENRKLSGRFTWFINKGKTNRLSNVDAYLNSNKFHRIDVGESTTKSGARLK